VISRDIAVVDCHPEHWINLVRGPGPAPGATGPRGTLLIVHRDERILQAAANGRPLAALIGEPVGDLATHRRTQGVKRVVCLEQGFMRRAVGRADSALRYDMDYVQQLLLIVDAFRRERGTGIRLDPPSPPGPVPPFGLVQAAFDLLWPDDSAVVVYVIDEPAARLFTSLILRKRAGDVDLLTSDLHLGAAGLDPGAWRQDRLRLLAEVEARVARVFCACFASLPAWRGLLSDPLAAPGEGAILDPWPLRLAWPLRAAGLLRGALRWMPSRG
jgi:hypothetical protein